MTKSCELRDVPVPAQRTPAAGGHGLGAAQSDTRWQRRYARPLRVADLAVITSCVAVGVAPGSALGSRAAEIARPGSRVTAWLVIVVGLHLSRAWKPRVLGIGTTELRRVTKAFAGSAICVGLAGLAFDVVSVKPWVFGVIYYRLKSIRSKRVQIGLRQHRRVVVRQRI